MVFCVIKVFCICNRERREEGEREINKQRGEQDFFYNFIFFLMNFFLDEDKGMWKRRLWYEEEVKNMMQKI